jgi:hypothetical protein
MNTILMAMSLKNAGIAKIGFINMVGYYGSTGKIIYGLELMISGLVYPVYHLVIGLIHYGRE